MSAGFKSGVTSCMLCGVGGGIANIITSLLSLLVIIINLVVIIITLAVATSHCLPLPRPAGNRCDMTKHFPFSLLSNSILLMLCLLPLTLIFFFVSGYLLTLQFMWTYMGQVEKLQHDNPEKFIVMLLFGALNLLLGKLTGVTGTCPC